MFPLGGSLKYLALRLYSSCLSSFASKGEERTLKREFLMVFEGFLGNEFYLERFFS